MEQVSGENHAVTRHQYATRLRRQAIGGGVTPLLPVALAYFALLAPSGLDSCCTDPVAGACSGVSLVQPRCSQARGRACPHCGPGTSGDRDITTIETCSIERWRGYFSSAFLALSEDGEPLLLSRSFRWRGASPPPDAPPARRAYDGLVAQLAALGWRSDGAAGPEWYAAQFVRAVERSPTAQAPWPTGVVALERPTTAFTPRLSATATFTAVPPRSATSAAGGSRRWRRLLLVAVVAVVGTRKLR